MSKEKVEVRSQQNRCPYCHDEVESAQSVACQGCLTRHHDACWSELGNCGSCGGTTQLQASRVPLTRETVASKFLAEGYSLKEVEGLLGANAEGTPSRIFAAIFGLVFVVAASIGAGVLLFSILTTVKNLSERNAIPFGFAGGLLSFGLLGFMLIEMLRRK